MYNVNINTGNETVSFSITATGVDFFEWSYTQIVQNPLFCCESCLQVEQTIEIEASVPK